MIGFRCHGEPIELEIAMSLQMCAVKLSAIATSVLLFASPLALAASDQPGAQPTPPSAPRHVPSASECEVWNRERSFAASVDHHDAAAFAEHVHPQAAFDASSPEPTRGREAIVASWKDLIAGKSIKLGWSPSNVTLGGDGNLAVSSGPVWIEDPRPNAKQRYMIGEFSSI